MTISLSLSDAIRLSSAKEWGNALLAAGKTLKLKVTSWQLGSVVRTVLGVVAYGFQAQEAFISGIAQGGLLRYAAFGTITFTDATGKVVTQPVTPEFGPGFLDLLCDSNYDVQRVDEDYAGGVEALTNTSGSTYGPFAPGTYHIANVWTQQTYSNVATLTIPPSVAVDTVADVTDVGGAIQIETSSSHGLTDGNIVTIQGVVGITALVASSSWRVLVTGPKTFLLVGSTYSGTYTSGGTVYAPTVATFRADTIGTVGDSLDADGVPNVGTITQPVTSLVGVKVHNVDTFLGADRETNAALYERALLKLKSVSPDGPTGAYRYYALTASKYAALLTPPRILSTPITRETTANDVLTGTVYSFVANQAGPPGSDDLTTIRMVVNSRARPNAVTARIVAATPRDVAVTAVLELPTGYDTIENRAAFQKAVQDYVRTFPIGGESDPEQRYSNILPREGVSGAIWKKAQELGIPLLNVILQLDGREADVQLAYDPSSQIAEVVRLSPAAPVFTMVAS